jgi:hypothetical protein
MKNYPTEIARQPLEQFRYQVYRQMKAGYYARNFEADTAADALKVFLLTVPTFDGGSIRLWDRQEEKLLASVEWSLERTTMGFDVRMRTNVFHDEAVAQIAREIAERETMEQSLRQELKMSA